MDVKGCAFDTRYDPAMFFQDQTCNVVRSRQQQVHTDVLRKTKQVDAKYNGWDKYSDVPGTMDQRLDGSKDWLLLEHMENLPRTSST